MAKFRWILVFVLIVVAVGVVMAQHQRKTPSMEQRVLTLELKVAELIDMHKDVMGISDDKNYARNVKRRMQEFQRNINTIPMRVRSKLDN